MNLSNNLTKSLVFLAVSVAISFSVALLVLGPQAALQALQDSRWLIIVGAVAGYLFLGASRWQHSQKRQYLAKRAMLLGVINLFALVYSFKSALLCAAFTGSHFFGTMLSRIVWSFSRPKEPPAPHIDI